MGKVLSFGLGLLLLACSNGERSPGLKDTSPGFSGEGVSPSMQQKQRPPRSKRAPAAEGPKWYPVFDFAQNLERAHLRSGGLLMDFGTPAQHKYNLGGWRTGWRGEYNLDGVTFSYIRETTANLFFDILEAEAGGASVTIKAKGIGASTAKLFLNEKHIGNIKVKKDEFVHATLETVDGLKPGVNEIKIRCNERWTAHDGKKAALAVDYIRVVPKSVSPGNAASSYDAVRYPSQTGGSDAILLGADESLTYYLPVPQKARIGGQVRARAVGGTGQLEVALIDPEGKLRTLAEYRVGDNPQSVKLPLQEYTDSAAGFVFKAYDGEVVLQDVRVESLVGAGPKADGKRAAKNFVLVLIDTLRSDRLSTYNDKTRVQTKYLDKLGLESMVFDNTVTPENWTKPAIASMLTGLYPDTHKTFSDSAKLPRTIPLASTHFKKLGYATAGFVANGYISDKFGFRRGFDTWTNYVREGKRNRAEFVIDDATAWLEEYQEPKPFFLYVHTIDPHVPYIPPKRYWTMYDNEPYKGPVQPNQTAKLLERVKTGKLKLNERDKIRLEALYDGEVTYHDDHLARLHQVLQQKGLLEDTLIIVTSDHGEEFFEHGKVGHGHSLYQELLSVPFFVRLPGAVAGDQVTRSAVDMDLTDVLPTACDVLGVECPPDMEGRSLIPLMDGRIWEGWPRAGFTNFLKGGRSVRMGRYKLFYKGLGPHVFDLNTDPRESQNRKKELLVAYAMLRDTLGLHLGNLKGRKHTAKTKKVRKKHKAEEAQIDPATKAQLQELGYLLD